MTQDIPQAPADDQSSPTPGSLVPVIVEGTVRLANQHTVRFAIDASGTAIWNAPLEEQAAVEQAVEKMAKALVSVWSASEVETERLL